MVVEAVVLAAIAIPLIPMWIGFTIKEEIFDKRKSKDELRSNIGYYKMSIARAKERPGRFGFRR